MERIRNPTRKTKQLDHLVNLDHLKILEYLEYYSVRGLRLMNPKELEGLYLMQ